VKLIVQAALGLKIVVETELKRRIAFVASPLEVRLNEKNEAGAFSSGSLVRRG
jgi:hypothetical protein